MSALVDGFTPRESDPLEAQVAALLEASGNATTAAMEEAEQALAAKVSQHWVHQVCCTFVAGCYC